MTRPGDIFHPDFSLGKAAYFDISVWNLFTPSHLINAAIKTGAAAEAGEVDKDECHHANVQVMAVCSTLLLWNHTECGLHIVWRY